MMPEPTNLQDFGGVIRWNRLQARLTLKQVAEKMGYSIAYQSDLERGMKIPTVATVQKLSKIFGLNQSKMEEKVNRNITIPRDRYIKLIHSLKVLAKNIDMVDISAMTAVRAAIALAEGLEVGE